MEIGNVVEWESQAGGSTTKKKGTIIRILQEKDTPFRIARREFPNHKLMFDGLKLPGKSNKAYLVEVIIGKKAKPRLYMPYPNKLKQIWES